MTAMMMKIKTLMKSTGWPLDEDDLDPDSDVDLDDLDGDLDLDTDLDLDDLDGFDDDDFDL